MGVLVMDIMAILIATTMETIVTRIVVTTVQGMAPIVGDEIEEQGNAANPLRLSPAVSSFPPQSPRPICSAPLPRGFVILNKRPARSKDGIPTWGVR